MRFFPTSLALLLGIFLADSPPVQAEQILVEAESFDQHGGWKLDTQFIQTMGSPYLLAHGLGRPVDDAVTQLEIKEAGNYRVFVRTFDWTARWNAKDSPGRFQVLLNGRPLKTTFGVTGNRWGWIDGGTASLPVGRTELRLKDLTGFDGRCDAILLTSEPGAEVPPNEAAVLADWRRTLLGLSDQPTNRSGYDLVIVGGGYSGIGTALSASRMGCRVALIQNRPVLGGNGSSEVRVWAMGNIRRGRFPRIGEIVEEFCDHATKSPGRAEEFEDARKEAIVRAEKNIDLFLNHHAYEVKTQSGKITGIVAFDTRTSEQSHFSGQLFCDCTGHGTIGFLAGADWDMTARGRMGMSNMWRWDEVDKPRPFPETPWALPLTMKDFPYPRDHHGQWFWEGGFDKDPIKDAEGIRDWNLRAVYGAFNAMKNGDGAAKHEQAELSWVAYIGGPRESRRLLGDVILSQNDIVKKQAFPDGCVPSTWSIDLHYPKKQYAARFPENPFISIAVHDRRIDRLFGYPVPYRCFYSRNIPNLFMAGRCISVTHEALGTTRVMKTCGMMGEVVGKAASLCILHECHPRDVYEQHLGELLKLLELPGKAFRRDVRAEIIIPEGVLPLAGPYGPPSGVAPDQLDGLVVDDRTAQRSGPWTSGTGLKGYVGWNYLYASPGSKARIEFEFNAPTAGNYDIRVAYRKHENRGTRVPVTLKTSRGTRLSRIDMTREPPLANGFISIGQITLKKQERVQVIVTTEDAGGIVHADAVQAIVVKD